MAMVLDRPRNLAPQPTKEIMAAEVLERAIEVLNTRGWTQFRTVDHLGRVCAEGAVRIAVWGDTLTNDFPPIGEAIDKARLAMLAASAVVPNRTGGIVAYNDAEAKTKEDVQAVMRYAANLLRAGKTPVWVGMTATMV